MVQGPAAMKNQGSILEPPTIRNRPGESIAREQEQERERADYHAELGRKYARAARFPWLPVAPDAR